MKGERAIQRYVAAMQRLRYLAALGPADISDYERTVTIARATAQAAYRCLNGSQIGEARRRLAHVEAPV